MVLSFKKHMKLRGNSGEWYREENGSEEIEGRLDKNHIICIMKLSNSKN